MLFSFGKVLGLKVRVVFGNYAILPQAIPTLVSRFFPNGTLVLSVPYKDDLVSVLVVVCCVVLHLNLSPYGWVRKKSP
jgi:hypothetical protein